MSREDRESALRRNISPTGIQRAIGYFHYAAKVALSVSTEPNISENALSGGRRIASGLVRALSYWTRGRGRTVSAYAMAFLTVALGTAFRLALDPLLADHHPFTIYFAAVAVTA